MLRAILNTAVEDRHLIANPCAIKGAGVEAADERAIPDLRQVFALADAVAGRYRALVLLAAFGGLRKGELFGLRRVTAAGRRTLALPDEVVPALEQHLATWVAPEPEALAFVGR